MRIRHRFVRSGASTASANLNAALGAQAGLRAESRGELPRSNVMFISTHAWRLALPCLIVSLLFAAGCGGRQAPAARPIAVVSVSPFADVVEKIAGDLVAVEVLVPPGANPETYEPALNQMAAIETAALCVKVGHPHFPFETTWLESALRDHPGIAVVGAYAGGGAEAEDPHVWLDPDAMLRVARGTAAELSKIFPGHKSDFESRLSDFEAEAEAVDAEVRRMLAPYAGRRFYVYHPAWGHFAQRYGLEQVAIENEGKEPSPAQLAALIDQARAEGVRTISVQPQFNRGAAVLVAREIGAEVVELDPLATDWAGNLRAAADALARSFAP